MSTLVSALQDAAASREAWPDALKALTEAAGVAGTALIISNKHTGNVEDACFSGLSAEFESDYIRHYATLDPYSPLLDGSWKKLSGCFPDPVLRRSEWYNDFVLACGVRDILGARLVDTPDYRVIFGIHQQIGRSFPARFDSLIELATDPLRRAAEHNVERLRSTIGARHDPPPSFRLIAAGIISISTMARGMRTKQDPSIQRKIRPRRMRLPLPGDAQLRACGLADRAWWRA